MLATETEGSYKWALEISKEMLGGKDLHTIVTYGDKAMRNAIVTVFRDATHRVCAWHLSKNIKGKVKNSPDFKPQWS
ncbi:unnamed protein product, partial [Linum tenue]